MRILHEMEEPTVFRGNQPFFKTNFINPIHSEVNSHFSKPIVSTLTTKATWEAESRVKEHFAESLKEFKTRKKSGNDPADYKQVKINDKKWKNSCLVSKTMF